MPMQFIYKEEKIEENFDREFLINKLKEWKHKK